MGILLINKKILGVIAIICIAVISVAYYTNHNSEFVVENNVLVKYNGNDTEVIIPLT